jgi:drug/metabolite transporter (DMT)-like permease
MNLSDQRRGEIYVLLGAILWGLFPVLTVLSENKVAPLIALGFSTLFSSLFFGALITIRKKWKELLQKSAILDILITTLILGVLYYILTFFGLRLTSPGNASIIGLSEILMGYIFFHFIRKEEILRSHVIGAVLVSIGVIIIFIPNFQKLQLGDLLILSAACIAPFGNFFQRRARTKASSESILFIRSVIGTIIIFFLAFMLKDSFTMISIKSAFLVLFISGVFVFGLSKIFWIEGIHRISIVKASALNCISPLVTISLAWLILQKAPTIYQLLSIIPLFFGIIFLSRNKTKLQPQTGN